MTLVTLCSLQTEIHFNPHDNPIYINIFTSSPQAKPEHKIPQITHNTNCEHKAI